MKPWQKPEFIELCMNAEIGAYQEDTGDQPQDPPLLLPAKDTADGKAEEAAEREHVA
jgi:hypothetical protein